MRIGKSARPAFGRRLTALRKQRGLTQTDLAHALGATQRAVSYYETQAELPPGPAVVALARALGVSADELLGLRAPALTPREGRDLRLWKRFRRMAQLPERDQRAVLRLISSLAQNRKSA